jgi:spore coat polysaccharide biosynthesis protein SpsF
MRVAGIVQARMTSTRLPGKVLKNVLGKPLLEYQIERLNRVPLLDELIIATTTNREDDPVAKLCDKLGIATYRGSELDVLSRYYEAAMLYKADVVVRFTADCPIIDPDISGDVIGHYLENARELDYCGMDMSSYPRGTDTEVCSFNTLKEAYDEGHSRSDREHVTAFIHTRPDRYNIWRAQSGRDWGKYRLTVDTPEDFVLIKEIMERLYPVNRYFGLSDVIELLESNPELPEINAAIRQKEN